METQHTTSPEQQQDEDPLSPYQRVSTFQLMSESGPSWNRFMQRPSAATFQHLIQTTERRSQTTTTNSAAIANQIGDSVPFSDRSLPNFGGLLTSDDLTRGATPLPKTPSKKPKGSKSKHRSKKNVVGLGISFLPKPSKPTFTLFTKLPLELQLIIWTLALPGPRLLDARETVNLMKTQDGKAWVLVQSAAVHQLPALFQTCQNARLEALKKYTLEFGTNLRHAVYFDIRQDTLVMHNLDAMHHFSKMSGRGPAYLPCNLRYLAIHYDGFIKATKSKVEFAMNETCRRLGNLEEFVVVMPEDLDTELHCQPLKGLLERALGKIVAYRDGVCLVQRHDKPRCVSWKVPKILFLHERELLERRMRCSGGPKAQL